MPRTEPLQDPPAAGRIPEPDGDIVLADLANAIADYRRERAEWQRDRESFAQMRESLAEARAAESRLTEHVRALQNDVDRARQLAGREHHRAEIMASSLKDIHGALFTGDIYSLILRACLTLAGATRGLYITATHSSGELRIRAAIDVDGYPQAPPSPFIRALCEAVLEGQKTIFCNQDDDLSGLPAPAQESERFRNCLVAPAVLLHDFNGIIIAADKESGTFDDEDEASLLAVGDQAQVAVENVRLHRALEQSYLATVTVLADTIEAKDPYTFGHCEMVSRYALHTARKLGLGDQDQLVVRYSALLHDVGKIGVSDGILNKPGPLLPEERELMRAHVRVGHDLLGKVPVLEQVGEVVLRHHECYDGSGYPDGLAGDAIPVAARIVTVVDAWCAMITKRSYKEAYGEQYAREELQRCAGTQFDPQVVAAFLQVLDSPEAYRMDTDELELAALLPGFAALKH